MYVARHAYISIQLPVKTKSAPWYMSFWFQTFSYLNLEEISKNNFYLWLAKIQNTCHLLYPVATGILVFLLIPSDHLHQILYYRLQPHQHLNSLLP